MTEARPSNYWISSTAIYITLNAMGNPDYVQCNVVSNASILCYMKDIKGLGYDAGHNYRRWPLIAAPTFFEESGEKFVYVAIPKSESVGVYAPIVFPSEKVDLYGINAKGEQIGSTDYYYIYLQASLVVETNKDGTQERKWKNDITINTGTLSSDEAINAGGSESWWKYSSAGDTVEFTKTISKAEFERLTTKYLFFSGDKQPLTGIARDTSTSADSVSQIVTPKYVSSYGDKYFLSKTKKDTAGEEITFAKGLTAGEWAEGVSGARVDGEGRAEVETLAVRGKAGVGGSLTVDGALAVGDGYGINTAGAAVISALLSALYDGDLQRGFAIKDRGDGKYRLDITDLMVWGKAVFQELEVRRLSHAGGNVYLSGAGSRIVAVDDMHDTAGALTGWRCWLLADDGTTATQNLWQARDQARCQTFNIQAGAHSQTANRFYWRLVTAVSTQSEQMTDAEGNVLYDGKRFDWVVLAKDNCAEGSDSPAAGDTIVLDGNQDPDKADRQGVLILEASGAGTPRIVAYKGIDSYTHDGHEVFVLAPGGSRIVSSSFEWVSPTGQTVHIVNYRGAWQQGTSYAYYDQVSHNNALWLCTDTSGTSAEPVNGSAYWTKQLDGTEGKPGADGEDALLVQITTDRGTTILNGEGSRTLTAHVIKGATDITDMVPAAQFSWRRASASTADDTIWNARHEGIGNTLTVTADDVKRSAVFECVVTVS